MKKNKHIIKTVMEDSIAMELGIEPGDVLLQINGKELEDIFEIETTEMSRTELRKLQKEARSIIGKQLDRYYQTQGYQTNYEIEIWNLNDWGL